MEYINQKRAKETSTNNSLDSNSSVSSWSSLNPEDILRVSHNTKPLGQK